MRGLSRGLQRIKGPRRKNSHVSTSITPNPCLVHPLLWKEEGEGEEGKCGVKMVRRESKRNNDEEKQRKDKSSEEGKKKDQETEGDERQKGKNCQRKHQRWASVWNWEWGCKPGRDKSSSAASANTCIFLSFQILSRSEEIRANRSDAGNINRHECTCVLHEEQLIAWVIAKLKLQRKWTFIKI